jgi:PleD family two-component response regulator
MNGHLPPIEQQLCEAKILIVDDEEADIRALEWGLRQAGYPHFRSLTDPARAREEFVRFQPDLVILDLRMPELDGFGVLKQLRESAPAGEFLPVLMLTGENTAEIRNRALASGVNDFLGKPVDYAEAMMRVKNLLHIRFLHRQARAVQARLEALSAAKETNPHGNPGGNP